MSYPPYRFQCQYEHACPFLDGLSTTWVYSNYKRNRDDYQEQLTIIDRFQDASQKQNERIRLLERENAELKAKLKMLHQRQFKANRKTDAAAIQDQMQNKAPLGHQKSKKRGAPVGHPGWSRPIPDRIDRTIFVEPPTVCPYCQRKNIEQSQQLREHIQEDIVLAPQTEVCRYVHGQAFCATCNRLVAKAGEGEILNAHIGPVAKSVAIYLRYRIGISYRKATELLQELFGLSFVPASAVGFDRKVSACGAPIYDDLREKIRFSQVAHADETSWRNNGIGHYAWFAGNEKLAFFHIDRSRSAQVAKAIFGDRYEGILVRDRYAAYNGIGSDWQSCLSHIITKAKEIKREHDLLAQGEKEEAAERFCEQVIAFFKDACEKGAKIKSGSIAWKAAKGIEKQLTKKLSTICKTSLVFKPAETLRAYISGPEQRHLFTFLRHVGVPPTNNHAEQSIRHLVIFRKICFGTRSESGLKTHSIIPSLVQTARRQGVPPRHFLQKLLTTDTQMAQAALFNDTG